MDIILPLAMLLLGLALGFGAAWWLAEQRRRSEAVHTTQLKETFQALSGEVLANVSEQATKQLLQLAEQKLDKQTELSDQQLTAKKQLIDQNLALMQAELKRVNDMVTTLEKDRAAKFSTLSDQLAKSSQQMEQLRTTTHDLKSALSNARIRGQWGDRMADDVLRLAGFVEGINYLRQGSLTDAEGQKRQPDYTFFLPNQRVVHMDVKFPLDQYLRYLEAPDDTARATARKQFIKEARARVAEAAKRDYATLASGEESTLDYTLVFIPNEQVYAFLLEHDRDILDTALQSKVILCSPTTLFAILAVIRQAVENFQLEKTTGSILRILADFQDQWHRYSEAFTKFGERLAAVGRDYDTLATTRKNQLERQLSKLESLKGLPAPTADVIEITDTRKAG
ncbi:MAG: DNA recombination protein RmuC [Pseudomonadaceae bacterium]|nr:DNA recombination protein RmuC [Pseudomonadaceae bacterium]